MTRAFLVLALFACTRTSELRQDEHATATVTAQATTVERVAETVQSGPETITTTVEEFSPAPDVSDQHPRATSGVVPAAAATGQSKITESHSRGIPNLIRRTVVVDHRGSVTDSKTAEAKGASSAALAAEDDETLTKKTKVKAGVSWLLWFGIGAGLAAVVYLLWRVGLLAKWWALL